MFITLQHTDTMFPFLPLFKRNDQNNNNNNNNNMQNFEQNFEQIKYENTIPFIPEITKGKVVKVYDGDTITIAAQIEGLVPIYRFHVRLRGIDSPEIKGKTAKEKEYAIVSRDKLAELIMNKQVVLTNVGTEKYGRLLADVYYGDINISQWMLENKLAVPYDGGTKKEFI